MLSCVCTHTHIQRLFPREKKTSSIYRRKEFHEQAQHKVSRHRQVCPRTTRTKSDSTDLYCLHHCLLNVSPFPSASSRALHNEGTKNKELRDTKPNLLFPLGTCRLSDSCSARVTLARVSSSCARDGEISTHFGNYFDLHHRLQTRARETREVCLIRSKREREKKKIDVFPQKKTPF